MKKIIVSIVIIVTTAIVITGCGNLHGDIKYKKIHVDTHRYSGCFTIEKWHRVSDGVEVMTQEIGSMYLAEGTYIIMEGNKDCPFCLNED